MNIRYVSVTLFLLLAVPGSAAAQHIYFDTDGDGVHSDSDFLNPAGVTDVSVYLDTCHGVEGAFEPCNAHSKASSSEGLDLFAYNLILTVESKSGSVRWGKYVDAVGFSEAQDRSSPTELLVSRRGTEALSPGRYLLGKIPVTTLGGSPILRIATSSKLDPAAFTGFGTHCEASDYPNTYVLGIDWVDPGSATAPSISPDFVGLRITPPSRNGPSRDVVFRLTLGSPSPIRLAIFDVNGRLVRTVAEESRMSVGTRELRWDARSSSGGAAASGIYFVRLDAGARKLTRKLLVLK